MMTIECEERLE